MNRPVEAIRSFSSKASRVLNRDRFTIRKRKTAEKKTRYQTNSPSLSEMSFPKSAGQSRSGHKRPGRSRRKRLWRATPGLSYGQPDLGPIPVNAGFPPLVIGRFAVYSKKAHLEQRLTLENLYPFSKPGELCHDGAAAANASE